MRQQIEKSFLKPIEVDIRNYFKTDNHETRLKAFDAVLKNDENYLIEYIKKAEIENTLERQTPLMLASMLNRKPLVKILIDEAGIIDNLDYQAIDYTTDKEIIEMLSRKGESIYEDDRE